MKEIFPLAVNIRKLQQYNFNFFSLEEVVLFEYLIIKAKSFQKEFFHSSATIEKETGIKRYKLEAILTKFVTLGIIRIEIKGFPLVKNFVVDFSEVQCLLPKIYQVAETSKLYAGYFKPLAETCIQKNTNKNINKNIMFSSDVEFFINFLEEIKTKEKLSQSQLVYAEKDLHRAIDSYKMEIILLAVKHYFKNFSRSKTIHLFLQPNPLNAKRLPEIEIFLEQQRQRVVGFIKKLNLIHNERRSLASTDKKTYASTQLVINKAATSEITKLLNVKTEQDISNAFTAYCDDVLDKVILPRKFLPYFLAKNNLGEYSVIDKFLDNFNILYKTSELAVPQL